MRYDVKFLFFCTFTFVRMWFIYDETFLCRKILIFLLFFSKNPYFWSVKLKEKPME